MTRIQIDDIPDVFIPMLGGEDGDVAPEFRGWASGDCVLRPSGKLIVETTRVIEAAGGLVPARPRARVWAGDADPSAFNVHQVLPVDINGMVVELPIDALEVVLRLDTDATFNLPYRGWRRAQEFVVRCSRCKVNLALDVLPDCA